MSVRFFLDPVGGATLPGAQSVTSEADFLRLALSEHPLLLHGEVLCSWGRKFSAGRGWITEEVRSPSAHLQALLPQLSSEDVQTILAEMPELVNSKSVEQLAQMLLNTQAYAGDQIHAAHWLLWWVEQSGNAANQRLMTQIGNQLADRVEGIWRAVYAHTSNAEGQLHSWLRLKDDRQWPSIFPLPLTPGVAQRLRQTLELATVARGVAVYRELRERQADPQMLLLAGAVAGEWLRHHPEELSRHVLLDLQDHLPTALYQQLSAEIPRPLPSLPPLAPAAWANWMTAEYLPYRSWEQANHEALRPHHKQFVESFLPIYAAALNGGMDAERLIWNRSAALKGQAYVTLVAVCDGLHLHDLTTLQRELSRQDGGRRLTLIQDEVVLGALPTITRRAKPALFRGVAPAQTEMQELLGCADTREETITKALKEANIGQVVFWNILEPDATYHKAENLDRAKDKVAAELSFIAKRLLYVLNSISTEMPVQLVVTTDHGRLLRTSTRSIPAPAGFASEGRAAYGLWETVPAEGFTLTDNSALLGRSRFGLAEDAVALYSDESFLNAAGQRGTVICPHGGLSPEEVLLPWTVYVRDLSFQLPTITAAGQGTSEHPGSLILTLVHTNSVPLVIERLSGSLARKLPEWVPWTVAPQSSESRTVHLSSWPKESALAALTLRATVRTGQGQSQEILVKLNLETEELYTATNDILGDLL